MSFFIGVFIIGLIIIIGFTTLDMAFHYKHLMMNETGITLGQDNCTSPMEKRCYKYIPVLLGSSEQEVSCNKDYDFYTNISSDWKKLDCRPLGFGIKYFD